jgi:hypothetical protein
MKNSVHLICFLKRKELLKKDFYSKKFEGIFRFVENLDDLKKPQKTTKKISKKN